MRIAKLTPAGIFEIEPVIISTSYNKYAWAFVHGPEGFLSSAKVWIQRFPLHVSDFPPHETNKPTGPFYLEPMKNANLNSYTDRKGNELYLLRKSHVEDNNWLVLWHPCFLPTNNIKHEMFGDAEQIGSANASIAGEVEVDYPTIFVNGACALNWTVDDKQFSAVYNGEGWEFKS